MHWVFSDGCTFACYQNQGELIVICKDLPKKKDIYFLHLIANKDSKINAY